MKSSHIKDRIVSFLRPMASSFQRTFNTWPRISSLSEPGWWSTNGRLLSTVGALTSAGLLYYSQVYSKKLSKETKDKIWAATRQRKPIAQPINNTPATIILSDGRALGYAEYGSATGRPILAFPGVPSCRLDFEFWHETAQKLDARIISIDRPGVGLSSPHPNRTLLDHAHDVEQLADHLKLDSYGVVGMSGGGPYALACAYALPPDKLKAVSMVCGLGPPDIGYYGMAWPNYCCWTFGWRLMPRLVLWWASRQPMGRLDLSDDERFDMMVTDFLNSSNTSPKEIELMMNHSSMWRQHLRSTRGAFVNGLDSFTSDGLLMSSPWEYKVEDIRKDLPVQLWYGKQDVNVPANHGVQLKKRLGANATLRIEDETHASLEVNYREEQLAALLQSME